MEMGIERERFGNVEPTHNNQAGTVRKAPLLVGIRCKHSERLINVAASNPFDPREIAFKNCLGGQNRATPLTAHAQQSKKLIHYVVRRKQSTFVLLDELSGTIVMRIC